MSNLLKRRVSQNTKKSIIDYNPNIMQKENNAIGNSFFERDENNLYELFKSDILDSDINYSRNKANYDGEKNNNNNSEECLNMNLNSNVKNTKRNIKDKNKLKKNLYVHEVKKKFEQDQYFIPENSPRINRNETEPNEIDVSSSNSEYSIRGNALLKETLDENQKLKIYDAKELNDYYEIDNKIDFSSQLILDEKSLEKFKNKNSLLSNNVILIRPQILASKKQLVYKKLIENNEHGYMYEIIKQQEENEKIKNEDVEFKIEMFKKFMEELKLKKYKEKLQYLVVEEVEEEAICSQKEMKDLNYYRKEENFDSKKKSVIKKNVSCCKRFNSFFFGNPLRSCAKQKHIWCGDYGAFDYDIQDHRIFDAVDTPRSNSAGDL